LHPPNVLAEGFVDFALVITAAKLYVLTKPVDDFVVEADGGSRFALRFGSYGAPFRLAEIVCSSHLFASY
jgi:hypothetical protein